MDEQKPNPFASPAAANKAAIPDFDPDTEIREFDFWNSLTKWVLVCFVSGAPSFYFGSVLGRNYAIQSIAMALGILTFVAFYVYIESREWTRRKLMDKSLRVSVRIGYITRMAISVLFPIAMFPDILCGMLSIGFTTSLFGEGFGPGSDFSTTATGKTIPLIIAWFYCTTLVQGVLVNIVLGAYTLIVYAIVLLFRGRKKLPGSK